MPIRISQLLHHLIETNADLEEYAHTKYQEKKILGLSLVTLMTPANDVLFACLHFLDNDSIPLSFLRFVADKLEIEGEEADVFFEDVLAFEFCTRRPHSDYLKLHDDLQASMPESHVSRFTVWEMYMDFLEIKLNKAIPGAPSIMKRDLHIIKNYDHWSKLFLNLLAVSQFNTYQVMSMWPDSLKTMRTLELLTLAYSFAPIDQQDTQINQNFDLLVDQLSSVVGLEIEEGDEDNLIPLIEIIIFQSRKLPSTNGATYVYNLLLKVKGEGD